MTYKVPEKEAHNRTINQASNFFGNRLILDENDAHLVDQLVLDNIDLNDPLLSLKDGYQLLPFYYPAIVENEDFDSSPLRSISSFETLENYYNSEDSLFSLNLTSLNPTPIHFPEDKYEVSEVTELDSRDCSSETNKFTKHSITVDDDSLQLENDDLVKYQQALNLLEKQLLVIHQLTPTTKQIPKRKKLNSYLNRHIRYALKIRSFLVSDLSPYDTRFRKELNSILQHKLNLQLIFLLARINPKFHHDLRSFVLNKIFKG